MVVFNYSGGEINTKIVYYGPGLSGKTTNLEYIYSKMPTKIKGKMISMKTRTDRTLFFDFLPLDLGDISGFKLRFLLYTVPGQVYYNATRKLVLKGADAVIFVADSARDKLEENIESLKNLETNLNEQDLSLDTISWAIQYNKRDLDNAMPVEELDKALNVLNVPSFEAVATVGTGVYETFQKISSMLYHQVKRKLDQDEREEEERDQSGRMPESLVPAIDRRDEDSGTDVSTVVDAALREVKESPDTITVEAVGVSPAAPALESGKGDRRQTANEDDSVEFDDNGVTNEPPGIASTPRQPSEPEAGEFKFASLKELEINGEVGRVVNLEADDDPSPAMAEQGKLLTDPCSSGAPERREQLVETTTARAVAVETAEAPAETAETVVTIPVVLSPSQIRKNSSLKLVLKIKISDE